MHAARARIGSEKVRATAQVMKKVMAVGKLLFLREGTLTVSVAVVL